ncbi:MAG: cytidine deaminase [Armatimonadota bacterium]|nr:cytidine deaminase [Armatimonadota bacterium]
MTTELSAEIIDRLVSTAIQARGRAYAPYSGFSVGAAVMGESENLYAGANVENASYGLTVCAERVAVFNAVAHGERIIKAIAICSGTEHPAPPCGACLQVLAEFAPKSGSMAVILCTSQGEWAESKLSDYLPRPFSL